MNDNFDFEGKNSRSTTPNFFLGCLLGCLLSPFLLIFGLFGLGVIASLFFSNTSAPNSRKSASVTSGMTLRIDGSTSMVTINQNLKRGFEKQYPGTVVTTQANGTDLGIRALLAGTIDIAAVSRSLNSQEQSRELVAVLANNDAIAVVVGKNNPFRNSLSATQIKGIFEGKINNWSALGGAAKPIRVINRPTISGTHQAFKELALKGRNFGKSPNFTTLTQDATTPLLQALKSDGIGYATYYQVANQSTVRTVLIDGVTPKASNYPYQRALYYVYKQPPSPSVKAFIDYTSSPQGQQAIMSEK